MKRVIYTGRGKNYSPTAPHPSSFLKIGQVYTVKEEFVYDWYTEYALQGIEGRFDSQWFKTEKQEYIVFSNYEPVVGESLYCQKMDKGNLVEWVTTPIITAIYSSRLNFWLVETKNSIYKVFMYD